MVAGSGEGRMCVRFPRVRKYTDRSKGGCLPDVAAGKSIRDGSTHLPLLETCTSEILRRLEDDDDVSRDCKKSGLSSAPSLANSTSPTAESAMRITPAFLSKITKRLSWALYLKVDDLIDLVGRTSCKVSLDDGDGWYHEDDEGPTSETLRVTSLTDC